MIHSAAIEIFNRHNATMNPFSWRFESFYFIVSGFFAIFFSCPDFVFVYAFFLFVRWFGCLVSFCVHISFCCCSSRTFMSTSYHFFNVRTSACSCFSYFFHIRFFLTFPSHTQELGAFGLPISISSYAWCIYMCEWICIRIRSRTQEGGECEEKRENAAELLNFSLYVAAAPVTNNVFR